MKICSKCGIEQVEKNFYYRKDTKRRIGVCNGCRGKNQQKPNLYVPSRAVRELEEYMQSIRELQ